ncbi:Mfa1 family fimbria major subunit [uncultured Alistipes sp.]|uniref:Mfa1 family fimbria major subunit n=2 Tax=uncultured Alistipes sp. TaxID=538949 RepID=UPI00261E347F|nr:Mfa1 family fimbria major subunit [uncultured Alistipes sp.]
MKKVTKLLAAFLMAGLAACSNNDEAESPVLPDDGQQPKASVYMSVNVQLPAGTKGTRSNTLPGGGSNDGEEQGKDYENSVNTLLLVLADQNDEYIAHGSVGGLTTTNATISATAAINRTTLSAFYEKHKGASDDSWTKINVYAFCNPTQELVDLFTVPANRTNWVDKTCEVIEKLSKTDSKNVTIWSKGSFLMSNAAPAEREIPKRFEDWTEKYNTEKTPFHLSTTNGDGIDNSTTQNRGSISVERSVARFDFKDGSPSSTGANTYLVQTTSLDKDGNVVKSNNLQVELVRLGLVNMSKGFYYLRRTSDNGRNDGANAKICGLETDQNYVVDTDAAEAHKNGGEIDPSTLSTYYNYCLFNTSGYISEETRSQWDNYKISDLTAPSREEDEDETWNTDKSRKDYRIWRYVTENTVPATDENGGQKNGVSTGIVFKGMLQAAADLDKNGKLYAALNGTYTLPANQGGYTYQVGGKTYPILYLHDNVLYVGWNDEIVRAATTAAEGSPLYNAVYNKPTKEGVTMEKSPNDLYQELVVAPADQKDAALAKFREAATAAGFTLYQASNDADFGNGYFFYYYYWNRHNDNRMPGTMGPMEFAVVRNNVYKLAVTEIQKLGHPRISNNDPDPVDPNDPDEKGDVYLSVSVQVLPWVVRVNDIIL